MKSAAIFLGGLLSGIIATLSFQHFQSREADLFARPGNFDIRFATERSAQKVDYGTPVFIADPSGKEFKLTFDPTTDGRVEYRWERVLTPAKNGSGILFEKYKTIKRANGVNRLKDLGSELRIEIEDLQLEWSAGGRSSGYIYYHPDDLTVTTTKS
jgi:hypothetical protein